MNSEKIIEQLKENPLLANGEGRRVVAYAAVPPKALAMYKELKGGQAKKNGPPAAGQPKAELTEEQRRVKELKSYTEADPNNQELARVVEDAIANGKTAQQVQARILKAIYSFKPLSAHEKKLLRQMNLTEEEYRAANFTGNGGEK